MSMANAARRATTGQRSFVGLMVALVLVPAAASADTSSHDRPRVASLVHAMTLDEKLSFVTPASDPQVLGEAGPAARRFVQVRA